MAAPLKSLKEVRLIERLARRLPTPDASVVVPIGDDAAAVEAQKGRLTLYTADMLMESVHFKKGEDGRKVGYKAMAVSVSDIAAMGGVPRYALISVGLPPGNVERTARRLFEGVARCARRFNIAVIGGDTNRSKVLTIDCFMVGEVEKKNLVLRSTARPGDHIFVSGPLGGSFSGKHLSFEPRLKEARFLVDHFKVTSMIDLSDGLGIDLNRVVAASRVGALIFETKIPRSPGVAQVERALFDGEDFELLFTLSSRDALALMSMMKKKKTGMSFYPIGRVTDLYRGVRMLTSKGGVREIGCQGFDHFR